MHRITLLIVLLAFTTSEGADMRTTKFKNVLWSVARKAGYSPESNNFISNQAIPVGEYINDWVGRIYSEEDWPEWTKVASFTPNATTHIVPYEGATGNVFTSNPYKIGRVLAVYLIDPKTTRAPVQTKYTLRDDGIHCGFEHGSNVWIKYIEPAPEFTAVPWRSDTTYLKDESVYSPSSGECYKSMVNNNLNHDPVSNFSPAPHLTIEETQALEALDVGLPAQDQIMDLYVAAAEGIDFDIPDPMSLGDTLEMTLVDATGATLAGHTVIQTGTDSIETLLTSLKALFDADALAGFTFTVIAPNKLRVTSTTTEFRVDLWQYGFSFTGSPFPMRFIQVQPFSSGSGGSNVVPQVLKISIGDDAFIPGATYSITVTDLDGIDHVVQYASSVYDNRAQILNGLLLQIGSSIDPIIFNIETSINVTEPSATLFLNRALGVNAEVVPPASQYWKLIPFPEAIFSSVVRGASADLMAEWGMNATATAEENKVQMETGIERGDFETTPTAPLTTQQRAISRYRIQ